MVSFTTLTLLMTLAGKVTGGWLQETSTWSNTFEGYLCVNPPSVDATCGWRMRVNSDPPLTRIIAYEGISLKTDGGRVFTVDNQHWNAADPDTVSPYCAQVQILGTFGNTMPDYVSVEWDCICVSSTCDPVSSAATASSTSMTSASTLTTLTSTPSFVTTSTALSSLANPVSESALFTKHEGQCHTSASSSSQVPYHLNCFRLCVHLNDCHGVNVVTDVTGVTCSFVTVSSNSLISSSSCNYWERPEALDTDDPGDTDDVGGASVMGIMSLG